jgi:hypothetical protein
MYFLWFCAYFIVGVFSYTHAAAVGASGALPVADAALATMSGLNIKLR